MYDYHGSLSLAWINFNPIMDLFVIVNFDALEHASDFQIDRRQVVFLCWMQINFNPSMN